MLADRLKPFLKRYDEISESLSDPKILSDISLVTKLSKEQRSIEPVRNATLQYLEVLKNVEDNKSLINDTELGDLAKEEQVAMKLRFSPEIYWTLICAMPNFADIKRKL